MSRPPQQTATVTTTVESQPGYEKQPVDGLAPLVAPRPSLTVSASMLTVLESRGVERVFCIPGGPISPLVDGLLDTKIELITCQHETMAVYAACGYSRATGKPGVVMVTSGPGILNALTGVAAAYHDEIPLLVFAGEISTENIGRGALQDGGPGALDVARMFSSITRGQQLLSHERRVAPMMDQAFATAMSHPRGPVLIRVPADLFHRDAGPLVSSESAVAALPKPTDAQCKEIAELLSRAKRPVLFAGLGAKNSDAGKALLHLAEAAQCPVITDLEGKGVIPETHPLSLGVFGVGARGSASTFLADGIDLMIAVGARFDDTTTANFSSLLQGTHTLIQLDYDSGRLGRAYSPYLTVTCDLPAALQGITSALPEIDAQGVIARRWNIQESASNPVSTRRMGSGFGPHDPRAVAAMLKNFFGEQAVFTCDIGNHMLFTAQQLVIEKPDLFHVSIGLGGMGSGLGMAIGLQLAHGKKRQVVSVIGDGGVLMTGNELATAVALKIPLVVVVFNDGQLGMVRHGHQRLYGRSQRFRTPSTQFARYARSLGAQAFTLDSVADLSQMVAWKREGPLLIDVPIMRDVRPANPREMSLNFSMRASGETLH